MAEYSTIIRADFHGMQPRLLIHTVSDCNRWMVLVQDGQAAHHAQVSIFIQPKDYARFERAAEAFNAIMDGLAAILVAAE